MGNDIVFKIRHKPTGLFYKPLVTRYGSPDDQLVSKGKLYKLWPNQAVDSIIKYGVIHHAEVMWYKPNDWEVVSFKLTELGTEQITPDMEEE